MKTIIFGPLPPPFGGARVSTQYALEFLESSCKEESLQVCDVPIRSQLPNGDLGGVSGKQTLLRLLPEFLKLPFRKRVIVFCSRNFGFTIGLAIIAFAVICFKDVKVRFFGGFPFQGLSEALPRWMHRPALFLLSRTTVVCQTYAGAQEFPESIKKNIKIISGYRPPAGKCYTGPTEGPFRFFYAGLVDHGKGIDLLVESAQRLLNQCNHLNFEIHLFGKVDEPFVSELSVPANFHFHGVVPNYELLRKIPDFDALVFPSRYQSEGHPGAIVESLIAGVAVIAPSLNSIQEIVEDHVNGLVFAMGDSDSLESSMRSIMEDKSLHLQLATGAVKSGKQLTTEVVLPKLANALGFNVIK